MPTIHYYGKKTDFVGKTLFEILANLKNFGINRMLIKQQELSRNPGHNCYYIVKKVEPIMDEKLEHGAIWAEKIFKGAKVPKLTFVEEESWHTDWQLIPKHLEHKYKIQPKDLVEHGHPSTVTVLSRWMETPPLMDIYLRKHFKERGTNSILVKNTDNPQKKLEIMMNYDFNYLNKPYSLHRIAEEGEEPTVKTNLP